MRVAYSGEGVEIGRFQKTERIDVVVKVHEFCGARYLDLFTEVRDERRPTGGPVITMWLGVRDEHLPRFFELLDAARAVFSVPGKEATRP